jgi:Putative restriction endonuclease
MDLTTNTDGAAAAVADLAAERLYRVSSELYRGLVEHGLIDPRAVALADGLLVVEPARDNGTAADPHDRLYRMPLAVYEGLSRLDLLGADDRKIELLDGLLVMKMTRELPHFVATLLTMEALRGIVPAGWVVLKEDPVALPSGPGGHGSMPEPDAAVIRGTIRDYTNRRPVPADMTLVVEVADSSLRKDRAKLVRYAWQRVPVAWIVNLNDRVVEVYTNPTGPVAPARYEAVATYGLSDRVPVVIDGREVGQVAVADLLP